MLEQNLDKNIGKEKDLNCNFKHLYTQIEKMPELIQNAQLIDKILNNHLPDLKVMSAQVIDYFKEQKKAILQKLDGWILPVAKDVLDTMLKDAEQSKNQLHAKIDQLDQISDEEWKSEAQHWNQLYSKWNDGKGLIAKILEVVADRAKQSIDKDIQVIKDYQTQSLSRLPQESEAFKNTEKRLAKAIEEPLKQLISFRKQPEVHTSVQQASEWIAKLQQHREIYFDQLLMKIDHVMKDVVKPDEVKDHASFLEVEGEIIFMESELLQIEKDLESIGFLEESDKQFILGRLEGLLDHLEQMAEQALPLSLNNQINTLKNKILQAISSIPE